jgi:hypothetical protein
MVNEAVIIELGESRGSVVRRTVDDNVSISKGTLMRLVDPNTASNATLYADTFAGIACSDKLANDGSTDLGFYTEGVFDLTACNEAITVGDAVVLSGANLIASARPSVSGATISHIIGYAEETASANEVIRVRLRD